MIRTRNKAIHTPGRRGSCFSHRIRESGGGRRIEQLTDVDILIPILYRETTDSQFERKDNSPLHHIVPTHGEAPRRVNEAGREGVEATGDGVHDSELAEGVDNVEHHDPDNEEVDKQAGRPAVSQGAAGADEEAGAD